MRAIRHNDRESGVVLVVVLWVVASMALLVSAFNATVRGNASVLASERSSAQHRAAVEAGLEIAASRLLADTTGRAWPRDGSTREVRSGAHRMAIGVQDANGLIDINKADERLILGLLENVTGSRSDAEQARDRILDWRDRDSRRRLRGAEDFNYERAGRDAGAGDSEFVDVTQLRDVLGIGPELYRRMAPYVTVYGLDGRVNMRTAPEQVLLAVPGISGADVDRLRRTDSRRAARAGARDEERAERLSSAPSDAGDARAESSDLSRNSALLTRDMSHVVIVRVALLNDAGETTLGLEAAIMPGADAEAPYRVLSWRLARTSLQPLRGR